MYSLMKSKIYNKIYNIEFIVKLIILSILNGCLNPVHIDQYMLKEEVNKSRNKFESKKLIQNSNPDNSITSNIELVKSTKQDNRNSKNKDSKNNKHVNQNDTVLKLNKIENNYKRQNNTILKEESEVFDQEKKLISQIRLINEELSELERNVILNSKNKCSKCCYLMFYCCFNCCCKKNIESELVSYISQIENDSCIYTEIFRAIEERKNKLSNNILDYEKISNLEIIIENSLKLKNEIKLNKKQLRSDKRSLNNKKYKIRRVKSNQNNNSNNIT